MIEKAVKEDLCQISLTGVRSLILLDLLIKSPASLEDIRKTFTEYNIMDDSNSDDILRIDINTLRNIGCIISRADHRTNNKFVLIDHPFKIDITQEEINAIKKVFNKIKENADLDILILYDNLFKKIAKHISDKEVRTNLLNISPLKRYSPEIIDEVRKACKNKNLVKLIYKAPTSAKETEKEIYADRVALQNDKLYLFCTDKESKQQIYLYIKRILKIISCKDVDDNISVNPITVKFHLTDFGVSGLNDNEEILNEDTNGYTICGTYHNNFLATQRILSFGANCTIIEPEDFKEQVVDILKKMRDIYNA